MEPKNPRNAGRKIKYETDEERKDMIRQQKRQYYIRNADAIREKRKKRYLIETFQDEL